MEELRLEVPHDSSEHLGIETVYDYTLTINPRSGVAVATAPTVYGPRP